MQIDRIFGIAAKYVGKLLLSFGPSALTPIPCSNLDMVVGSYGVQPSIGPDIYGSSSGGEIRNRTLVGKISTVI